MSNLLSSGRSLYLFRLGKSWSWLQDFIQFLLTLLLGILVGLTVFQYL